MLQRTTYSSPIIWDPEIELRSSGFGGKGLYFLRHLVALIFWFFVLRQDFVY